MDDLIEAGRRLRSYHIEPTPDVSEIHSRSERRRRRRRTVGGIAATVVTAVTITAIASALMVSSHPQNVTVSSGGGNAPLADKGQAVITIVLNVTRGPTGFPIKGIATVDNKTGKPIPEPDPSCSQWIDVRLAGHTTRSTSNNNAMLCSPVDHVPIGISRYPIVVQTTYNRCSQIPSQATRDIPACLGPERNMLPPLPPGVYQAVVSVSPPLRVGNSVTVQLTDKST